MIQKMANNENEKYLEFFRGYSASLKLGVLEDHSNKDRLMKLLRYPSTRGKNLTSFDEYIGRMKEGQNKIYFFASQDETNMIKSPFIEQLVKKDYEVLLMTNTIDEYIFQPTTPTPFTYRNTTFVNVAKDENLDVEMAVDRSSKDQFAPICEYLKSLLKGKVMNVKVSARLTDSPSALTTPAWGWTGNMEKLAKSQVNIDPQVSKIYRSLKVLELNPSHPLIVSLNALASANSTDSRFRDVSLLLYESSLLSSGFELDSPSSFTKRLQILIQNTLHQLVFQATNSEKGQDKSEL